jgi:hypothetical protein
MVPVATQHPSRKRAFASPSPGQIYTGHLPQSHNLAEMRTKKLRKADVSSPVTRAYLQWENHDACAWGVVF